jgi:hypothetical protein
MESRKYRTCGHGCARPGLVREQFAMHVLPQRPPPAGACLTRSSGAQPKRVPKLFAMAGT